MRTILLLLAFLFVSCSGTHDLPNEHEYIAHAGGAIDGYIYTNSKEALERAVADGYRFVEFDLLMTADSVLVAAHTWKEFNEITGYSTWGDSVPTVNEFRTRRIYGKYTPLTANDIYAFFVENKNIFLVTDKMSDADILEAYFPNMKDRMVVEAFSYNDFKELCQRGFYRVMYSCMAVDMNETIVKHLLLHRLFDGEKIEWITLHTSAFNNVLFKIIDFLCDYKAALFTVNDTAIIPEAFRKNIYMIYSDSIK